MKKTAIIVSALAALLLAIMIIVEIALANDRRDKIGDITHTDSETTDVVTIPQISPITTDSVTVRTPDIDVSTTKSPNPSVDDITVEERQE